MNLKQKIDKLTWYDEVEKLKDILTNIDLEGVKDAPIDNTQYIRKNGEWSPIAGSVGGSQEVSSYLELLDISVSNKLVIVRVLNDENKGIKNTIYHIYPDGVRMWIAANKDN